MSILEAGILVVFITIPRNKGSTLASKILERKLAACINILPVKSIYWWKNKLEEDEEELLIIKTTITRFEELIEEVKKHHPYEVPEIIAFPITACNTEYCNWIRKETSK